MDNDKILKALVGHKNAAEILAILKEDPEEDYGRRQGYIVNCEIPLGATWDSGNPHETVHTLAHNQGTWDPVGYKAYHEKQKEKRARHGLQFLEKGHRKGRYDSLRPTTRKKVLEAYKRQVAEEQGTIAPLGL